MTYHLKKEKINKLLNERTSEFYGLEDKFDSNNFIHKFKTE